jgi:hypothetical protein
MSSMFPPAASSSLPLPSSMWAPPVIPSLGDCFPCGSIDLGKYILYSSSLRQRARWHTSLTLLFGGHGMLPFADNSVNAVNADVREPKSWMQRFVYVWRDTEDGPLEIILPEESMWYKFYVCNFYITQDTKLAKAFHNRFRLPYPLFLQLVEDISSNDLFDRWCGCKSNNKTYSHPLFFISTYVGFVPVSDVLAIFVSDRRCEFSSKFWFVIRKKKFWWTSFGRTLGVPKQNMFW